MIKIRTHCTFYGDNFYPEQLENKLNLVFDEKNNPNEFLQDTKIKVEYGTATLICKGKGYPNNKYLDKISLIIKHVNAFKIDKAVLHMDIEHDGQCNFEFSPELLKKIASLNITLSITTF